jgi:hypothetical protein
LFLSYLWTTRAYMSQSGHFLWCKLSCICTTCNSNPQEDSLLSYLFGSTQNGMMMLQLYSSFNANELLQLALRSNLFSIQCYHRQLSVVWRQKKKVPVWHSNIGIAIQGIFHEIY